MRLEIGSSFARHAWAVVFSLIATGIVTYIDTKNETSLDNQKLQAIVDGVADSVDRQLSSWRLSLSAMAASSDLVEPYDFAGFSKEAKRFADLTGTNISFFREEGDGLMLYSHTQVSIDKLPLFFPLDKISAFYAAMKSVSQSGKAEISDFFVGPIAGELLSSVIIAKQQQPNTAEMLSLNFTSSYLSHILDQIQLPKDYIIGLVDRNGVIGARSENYKTFVGKVIPAETLKIYRSADHGLVVGDAVTGAAHDSYRISFRRLKEASGWTVSLLVPAAIYPTVTIGPLSVAAAFLSLIFSNALAWALEATQRQKLLLEESFRLSTRRLLDELPGAILRGSFTGDNSFRVILAFGKLANDVISDGRFRFEGEIFEKFGTKPIPTHDYRGDEWDINDEGRVYRLFMNISNADELQNIEYNIYIFDISNQRAAEAAAINSARLAALGQMAATLAHEMSQPLNVIALAADNAGSMIDERGDSRILTKILKIKEFALKGRKLIDNLLVYSRGDSSDSLPISVDLQRSIDLALDLTQPLLRSQNVDIMIKGGEDGIQVYARPVELENIFVNLLINAVDAYKQNPSIEKRHIVIDITRNGDDVSIRIADNAGGISDDIIQHVFEPFVTTKPVGHGTGLGLAFVLGNVRAWGGNISAQNTNGGAEFTIRLKQASA